MTLRRAAASFVEKACSAQTPNHMNKVNDSRHKFLALWFAGDCSCTCNWGDTVLDRGVKELLKATRGRRHADESIRGTGIMLGRPRACGEPSRANDAIGRTGEHAT